MAIKSRRKVLVIYTYAIPTIPVVPARGGAEVALYLFI